MTATKMQTPCGEMPIRQHVINDMTNMTDRQIADKALGGRFIDPEYYAELLHRGLSGPGMHTADTYTLIDERERNGDMKCGSQ